jgi:hypothetical protein
MKRLGIMIIILGLGSACANSQAPESISRTPTRVVQENVANPTSDAVVPGNPVPDVTDELTDPDTAYPVDATQIVAEPTLEVVDVYPIDPVSEIVIGSNNQMGMSWGFGSRDAQLEITHVGCHGRPRLDGSEDGPACDPYVGDTSCTAVLPILCLKESDLPRPNYAVDKSGGSMPPAFYRGWSGGVAGLSEPIAGTGLSSLEMANDVCAATLGDGFRMAEFHDGQYVVDMGTDQFFGATWPSAENRLAGGWGWFTYGDISEDTRFWVYINDQQANCWDGTQ